MAKEVTVSELDEEDWRLLNSCVGNFCQEFAAKADINNETWTKLVPGSSRPYGNLYNHK